MIARLVAARRAIDLLVDVCRDGCAIGIGTGTTVGMFIDEIRRAGYIGVLRRSIIVVSSIDTAFKLLAIGVNNFDCGLPRPSLDIYIDSADEVDRRCYMIKGGGGALLREKVLAYLSKLRVYIVDHSKVSNLVGEKKPLPVEVEVFALPLIEKILRDMGLNYSIRTSRTRYGPTMTDNANILIDVFTGPMSNPTLVENSIIRVPGVVATGLFAPDLVDQIIIGHDDGSTETLSPRKD